MRSNLRLIMQPIIPIYNQHSYRSIQRNKDLKLTINNHCDLPSKYLVVDWCGNCFVCSCEAYLPITVGNITDFTHLSDIWNSSMARWLQTDIDQKKFTHCAVDRCGVLDRKQTVKDHIGGAGYCISINIDESCNLQCPSCRRDTIMWTQGAEYDKKSAQVNHLIQLLEQFDQPAHIIMSGNGDPLASNIMRPFFHQWRPKHMHTIRLFTNGLLLEKQLTDNEIVDNITKYFISIDAGSASIYHQVRRPGRWDILLKNFDFLKNLVQRTGAEVLLKFVLQDTNRNDMQNFVDLCKIYGFKGVINRLEDWGTWDQYQEHDVVGNSQHRNHQETIINLKEVYQQEAELDHIQFDASLRQIATK